MRQEKLEWLEYAECREVLGVSCIRSFDFSTEGKICVRIIQMNVIGRDDYEDSLYF